MVEVAGNTQLSFDSLSGYGNSPSPISLDMGTPVAPILTDKQKSVQAATAAKQALLSGSQSLHTLATAQRNGNDLGSNKELVNDLDTMSALELRIKYGPEVAQNAYRWADAARGLSDLKRAQRTNMQALGDTALEAGKVAGDIVIGGGALIATLGDSQNQVIRDGINWAAGEGTVPDATPIAPYISKGLSAFDTFMQSKQSDLMQARRVQHGLEGQLDSRDSEALYKADLAANAGSDSAFDKSVLPWLNKQGRDFKDAITNYADDPIMQGSLAVNAVGSMVPYVGTIRALGASRALSSVMLSQNMTKEAAKVFIKKGTGKELYKAAFQIEAKRMVPVVTAIMEGGSSVVQTQQAMQDLTENELFLLDTYTQKRVAGKTHEEALAELQRTAGTTAGLLGGTLGAAVGMVARGFEVNPLKIGATKKGIGKALGKGAVNVGTETGEEAFQEGSNQLASNVGMRSAGMDVAIDEGVAAGAAEGALGGFMAAASLQAPGVALATTGEVAKAAGKGVLNVADAQLKKIQTKLDGTSSTGAKAQAAAADDVTAILQSTAVPKAEGDTTVESAKAAFAVAVVDAENAITEAEREKQKLLNQGFRKDVDGNWHPKIQEQEDIIKAATDARSTAADAVTAARTAKAEAPEALIQREQEAAAFLTEAEQTDYIEGVAEVKALKAQRPDQPITRFEVASALSESISKSKDPAYQKGASLDLLAARDRLMRMASTEVLAAADSLPEGQANKVNVAKIQEHLKTLNDSAGIKIATEMMDTWTGEDVAALPGLVEYQAKANTKAAKDTGMIIDLLKVYNVNALSDVVLNQKGNSDFFDVIDDEDPANADWVKKVTAGTKTIVESINHIKDVMKSNLDFVKTLPETKGKVDHSMALTSQDLLLTKNKVNGMMSLSGHAAAIRTGLFSKDLDVAGAALAQFRELATSQNNKLDAYNKSSKITKGNNQQTFEAYGPFGRHAAENLVYANLKSRKSMLLAKTAYAETKAIADVYNVLLDNYIKAGGKESAFLASTDAMTVTELDATIWNSFADQNATFLGNAKPKVVVAPTVVTKPAKPRMSIPAVAVAQKPILTTPNSYKAHLAKDQAKANKANKMIGRGSAKSSTNSYAAAFGKAANTGTYTEKDVVFISSEGGRNGRIGPDFVEIKKAVDAGVTFITDIVADRSRAYNVGEREVATYLKEQGYVEKTDGTWSVAVNTDTSNSALPTEMEKETAPAVTEVVTETKAKEAPRSPPNLSATVTETELKADVVAEINDVVTVLELLGLNIPVGKTVIPNSNILLNNQKKLLDMYADIVDDPRNLTEILANIADMFSWIKSDVVGDNSSRRSRAVRSAEKAGNSVNQSYIIQLSEELIEVIAVNDPKFDSKNLEVEKRKLKSLRFGKDTVIKDGSYKGMTNKEAYDLAYKAATSTDGNEDLSGASLELATDFVATNGKVARVWQAFKTKVGASTLMQHEFPSKFLLDNLDKIASSTGQLKRKLSTDQTDVMKNMLEDMLPEFKSNLAILLKATFDKKTKAGVLAVDPNTFQSGNLLDAANLRSLNLVQPDDNGGFEFSPHVVEALFFATMEWATTIGNTKKTRWKAKDLSKAFAIKEEDVNESHVAAYMAGHSTNQAVIYVANKTIQLLGLEKNNDITTDLTQGIFNAMAGNAFEVFESKVDQPANLFVKTKFKLRGDSSVAPLDYNVLTVNKNGAIQHTVQAFSGMPDVFSRVFLPGHAKTRYVGDAPTASERARNVGGNTLNPLSKKTVDVITKLENTEFKANEKMYQTVDILGVELFLDLMGNTHDVEAETHVATYLENESRNSSKRGDLEGALGYLSEIHEVVAQTGKSIQETPVFFKYKATSTNRLYQEGPVTPQLNKITRVLLTATNAVLDLSKANEMKLFMMTVAQSIGMSIDKKMHDGVLAETAEIIDAETGLKPALDIYKSWIQKREANPEAVIAADEKKAFIKAMHEATDMSGSLLDNTAAMIHAVVSVAHMQLAKEKGGEAFSKFPTTLSLEADGVTDGPMNAIMHLLTGAFTKEQIAALMKGGLFFSPEVSTINEFLSTGGQDIYNSAATSVSKRIVDSLQNSSEGDRAKIKSMLRILHALVPGFSVEFGTFAEPTIEEASDVPEGATAIGDGEYVLAKIGRNVIKNPLTIFVYGSGISGISAKMAVDIHKTLYTKFAEIEKALKAGEIKSALDHAFFKDSPSMLGDLNTLMKTRHRLTYPKGVPTWVEHVEDKHQSISSMIAGGLLKSVFLRETLQNIASAMHRYIGEHVEESINEVTDNLSNNMRFVQGASQIQNVIFESRFNALLKERKGDGPSLSETEVRKAFQESLKFAAIYETDAQSFHITQAGSVPTNVEASRNLAGTYQTTIMNHNSPKDAGVKVSPYMVIGTGDGRMVLNIYAEPGGLFKTSLQVFDGIEMSADIIEEGSKKVNEAVYKAWLEGNALQSMAESYERFIPQITQEVLDNLDTEAKKAISKAIWGPNPKDWRSLNIGRIASIGRNLTVMGYQSTARKKAIARTKVWVDHMASAMSPYESVDGEQINSIDPEVIVAHLNNLYVEELAKLKAAAVEKEAVPAIQAPTKEFSAMVAGIGQEVHEGVIQVKGKRLLNLLKESRGQQTSEQKAIVHTLLKAKALEDTVFFFGSNEALNNFKDALLLGERVDHPLYHATDIAIQNGIYLPALQIGLISNISPETTLHEVLHAVTANILDTYYKDPLNTPTHVQEAMVRLESLMQEFAGLNLSSLPDNVREAGEALQDELNGNSVPLIKMHEFLAWSLSNQHLIELGRKLKVYNPVAKVLHKMFAALKTLLGLQNNQKPGDTLFGNIRFNAAIILADVATDAQIEQLTDVTLNQTFGHDPHVQAIEQKFLTKLRTYLAASDPSLTPTQVAADTKAMLQKSENALLHVQSLGFDMNAREEEAFKAVHATMFSGMSLNPAALVRVQQLYSKAVQNLTSDAFLDDPATATVSDEHLASLQLSVLTTPTAGTRNTKGVSDILPTFMALSQVNTTFRKALETLKITKPKQSSFGPIDNAFINAANSIITHIINLSISTKKLGNTVNTQLDALAGALSAVSKKRRHIATSVISSKADAANAYIKNTIGNNAEKLSNALEAKALRATNTAARAALQTAGLIASIGSEKVLYSKGEALTRMLNQTDRFPTIRKILSDLRGMTLSNEDMLRLVNRAKGQIDALRQDYREEIPTTLRKEFTRKLTKQENSQLFQGIGRSDLLAFGVDESTDILNDNALVPAMIKTEEANVIRLGGVKATKYKSKAKALATYMITRKNKSSHLLPNAHAIASLAGTTDFQEIGNLDPALITAIDRLTSLYAFENLDAATKATMKTLMNTEPAGMKLLMGYHQFARLAESQRLGAGLTTSQAIYNGWKGYVPSMITSDAAIVVKNDSEQTALIMRGYTRIGDYKGDPNERYAVRRGLYHTSVIQRNAYRQGVAQTVHDTYLGVDTRNGVTRSHEFTGAVTGKAMRLAKGRIGTGANLHKDDMVAGEYLMPIFNKDGQTVAYNRPIAPESLVALKPSQDLPRMLGVWSGRIVEEELSTKLNQDLVAILKKDYDEGKRKYHTDEFVNVADLQHKDPVIRDIWETLGWQIKDDIRATFGSDSRGNTVFPVRRNMLEDMVGIRSASFTDPWTGTSRLNPSVQKAIRDVSTMVLGKNAYKVAAISYTVITDTVSVAKTNIVVKSIVVTTGNFASNVLQLLTWGIGLPTIVKGMRDKFIETSAYSKNKSEILDLTARLSAEIGHPAKVREIKSRIQALEDINKNLSITPLIEAWEFNTISEGLTEEDMAIREGRLSDYLEKAVDKLHIPQLARDVGKNILVTKDTALFKGMNRALQYGDFLAKAVLYDHLVHKKGVDSKEALNTVAQEFVMYNLQSGRGREFLESVGLLWFYNYKLRITKVAMDTIRNRPLHALMYMGGVGSMLDMDTVISGSLPVAAVDGRLPFSIGPEMGINSWTLNPLWNVTH